jgi:hypothetical protein
MRRYAFQVLVTANRLFIRGKTGIPVAGSMKDASAVGLCAGAERFADARGETYVVEGLGSGNDSMRVPGIFRVADSGEGISLTWFVHR